MDFNDLKALVAAHSRGGTPFEDAVKALEGRIFGLSRQATLPLIQEIGAIPESIEHDSSGEKLYAKAADILLAKALQELGLEATVMRERADRADVLANSKHHRYSLVADAKTFRLSRTAKNQKDFKVKSLSHWRGDSDCAVLVAPYYQYPQRSSQIYEQALQESVCLLGWEHLALMLRAGIKESKAVTLYPIWSLSRTLAPRVADKTRKSNFHVLGNQLICDALKIDPARLEDELERYRGETVRRAREEVAFWEARVEAIAGYSREQAIRELTAALKIKEKIVSIQRFGRQLGGTGE